MAMNLTLAEAAIGAGAVLEAPSDVANAGALKVSGYSIDSRTVGAGELCVRVASLPDAVLASPLLIAEDPLIALQALAAHVRRRWGKRVVAITGSAGKGDAQGTGGAAAGAEIYGLKARG